MAEQHLITPPAELLKQWEDDWFEEREHADVLLIQAFQAGAEQARAALEAQPEPVGPTDEELLELMPETMLDEFRYAAKVCSDATGGQVKPGIFRVCLNHTALEYAHAVLSRWGRPAIEPIPVSERLPEPKDCDVLGRCWMCGKVEGDWRLISTINPGVPQLKYTFSHWLPHWALPIPRSEEI